jgi:hypothetical protein
MDGPLASGAGSGFQAQGQAWHPSRPDIIDLLQTADHVEIEPIYYGSNHTFLVTLEGAEAGRSLAVYKPSRGEYPLYDFPTGTLYRREIASWVVNAILGWNVIPPTVGTDGVYGIGSLQLFIEGHQGGEITVLELRRLCLLDILYNNADRKAEHCLVGDDGKLWGIDHGLTFHHQPKLRTVLWHFAGSKLAADDMADLKRLRIVLTQHDGGDAGLRELLSKREWNGLLGRLDRLIAEGCFPDPRYKPVPYRW